MQTKIACLFQNWPGKFGQTFQQLIADPMCAFILGTCGNARREKEYLDECAGSGIAVYGYILRKSDDLYYWVSE